MHRRWSESETGRAVLVGLICAVAVLVAPVILWHGVFGTEPEALHQPDDGTRLAQTLKNRGTPSPTSEPKRATSSLLDDAGRAPRRSIGPGIPTTMPESPSSFIAGTVRWTWGEPVARAWVHAKSGGRHSQDLEVLTNEAGHFEFPGLSKGLYTIRVASHSSRDRPAKGRFAALVCRESVHDGRTIRMIELRDRLVFGEQRAVPVGRNDVSFTIDEWPSALFFQVVDDSSGKPVGAILPNVDAVRHGVRLSDPLGQYVLVCRGTVRFTLGTKRYSGYLASSLATMDLAPEVVREGEIIYVKRGGTVSGRVVGPDGSPVHPAVITAKDETTGRLVTSAVFTDKDGRFRLDGLAETIRLCISSNPCPPAVRGGIVVWPGLDVHLGDLRLAPGGSLVVTVTDEAGGPVRNARVMVQIPASGEKVDGTRYEVRDGEAIAEGNDSTDRKGQWRHSALPCGDCSVSITDEDGTPVARKICRIVPGTTTTLAVTLRPGPSGRPR